MCEGVEERESEEGRRGWEGSKGCGESKGSEIPLGSRLLDPMAGRRMDTWILFGYYRFEYPHSGYYRIGVSTLRIL